MTGHQRLTPRTSSGVCPPSPCVPSFTHFFVSLGQPGQTLAWARPGTAATLPWLVSAPAQCTPSMSGGSGGRGTARPGPPLRHPGTGWRPPLGVGGEGRGHERCAPRDLRYTLRASYLEVYNEQVNDMLDPRAGRPPPPIQENTT